MKIMTDDMQNEITGAITHGILQRQYVLVADRISALVRELRANIPVHKRTSFGIVYSIKTLSEYLSRHLTDIGASVFEAASQIFMNGRDFNSKSIGLGMLSYYGLHDYRKILPYFESAASSPDWMMREISQMLFRKITEKHPKQSKEYLTSLTESVDGHLRRFVAETLRPVQENKWFYKNPNIRCPFLGSSSRRLFLMPARR